MVGKLQYFDKVTELLVRVPLQLLVTDILNKIVTILQNVTSYVAEPLLRYIYHLKKWRLKR